MNDISIEEKFCESLKKFIETQHPSEIKGYISKLAKTLDVSQGYLSNVLAGRRPGSETWRRSVAQKLNLDYEVMIGIKSVEPNSIKSINHIIKFPHNNGPPASAEELIRTDMHQRLDEILHSGRDPGHIGQKGRARPPGSSDSSGVFR
jgi:hypothetical protein